MNLKARLAKLEQRFPKPVQQQGWPHDFLFIVYGTCIEDTRREICRRLKMMLADPRGATETQRCKWRETLAVFEEMLENEGAK